MENLRRAMVAAGLVAAAACGSKGRAATRAGAVGNAATPGALDAEIACPDPAEMATWLRGHWQLAPDHRIETSCVPGRFPQAGWAIAAVVDESESEAYARQLVLAATDRVVIAERQPDSVTPWYRAEGGGLVSFETVDFDGDGRDELTHSEMIQHGGTYWGAYQVEGIAGDRLETLLQVVTDDGNDEGGATEPAKEYACRSEVVITEPAGDGTRELIVTSRAERGDPARSQCKLGRTAYTLVGGAFASR